MRFAEKGISGEEGSNRLASSSVCGGVAEGFYVLLSECSTV